MAQHASEPPEHSAVFERSPARSAAALAPPPMVVASACRTTREVVAWAVATELGLRCYVAASAREALARLGLDPEGIPLMGSANATPMPGAMLLETDLLLEPVAGPALCRALHALEVRTLILRGGAPRDLVAAERAAASVLDRLRGQLARSA